MEDLMKESTEGQERIKRQTDKENEFIAQQMGKSVEELVPDFVNGAFSDSGFRPRRFCSLKRTTG